MSKNLSLLSGRKGIEENLFQKLGDAAEATGTPDELELKRLAEEYLMGDANTYGTITAYDFMKPENQGKEVYICNGSACLCAGTQDKVEQIVHQHFDADAVGHMTCLGRCHENSSFHYAGHNYSGDSINRLAQIISEHKVSQDNYYVHRETEVLTAPFDSIAEVRRILSEVLAQDSDLILNEIKESNIRGRGGAGFPMGIKWESCRNEPGDRKYIICNADEGDPGAYSDRYLLEERPLAVLLGMMIGGYCTGADWGILYIRAEYPEAVDIVQEKVNLLREQNLIGENIMGSGFNFNFKVVKARGAYICGEETALINSLEGQRPEVRTRPPYPTTQGLFLKPTVVNNVETLAAVPWIMQHSGQRYAEMGTERSKGTKLVCLDSHFVKPGIYEVEMGLPLAKLVYDLAGGFKEPVKALHIGGPLGGIVPASKIEDLTIDFESFGKAGFLLGHASIVSIPEDFPMIKYLEHLFDFASFESCGKCFPCRIGTRRAFEMLRDAAQAEKRIDRKLFMDLMDTLEQGSLCAHGGGIPLPAYNALLYFKDEMENYFS